MPEYRVSGRYRLDVHDPVTGACRSTGWFANLVTDQGLDMLGQGPADYLRYCQVGTGTATPASSDVALGNGVASAAYTRAANALNSAERYVALEVQYLFAAGAASGTIAEVGVGPVDDAASTSLFSRARVTDANGDPATVAVGAGEELRVYYELRVYQPTADTVTTVDGVEVTVRAAMADTLYWNSNGWWLGLGHPRMVFQNVSSGAVYVYAGDIAAITGTPSGSVRSHSHADSVTAEPYVAGSFERLVAVHLDPAEGNVTGGTIQALRLDYGPGVLQMRFDPPLAKDDSQALDLNLTYRWARRAP